MQLDLIRMLGFIGVISVIYFIVYYYFYRRYLKPVGLEKKKQKIWNIALFAAIYSSILPFFLFYQDGLLREIVAWSSFLIFGFMFILLPLSVVRDGIFVIYNITYEWIAKFSQNKKAGKQEKPELESTKAISRKEFLHKSNAVLISLTGISSLYGFSQTQKAATLFKHNVPLNNLPPQFRGFKIAQISDIHVGAMIQKNYVSSIVEQINELKPDMVAITGDVVDGSVSQLRKHTDAFMDLSSTYGTYVITGNHEYYSGVDEWLVEFERLNMKVLMNNHDIISKENSKSNLVIGGVPDIREGHNFNHIYDPVKALQGAGKNDVKILLAHQPKAIDLSVKARADLQLSGHTHGGQFFPWNLAVHLIYDYASGLHHHANKMWINVNRGTGYWGPPIRLGVPSEITLLTLV